eukprot:FR743732.1.p1 GENE.FR743732.1~~FR743732.1.p1  ORF type:complete len:255 (+),score=7.30 FR743732.1:77-766(+)
MRRKSIQVEANYIEAERETTYLQNTNEGYLRAIKEEQMQLDAFAAPGAVIHRERRELEDKISKSLKIKQTLNAQIHGFETGQPFKNEIVFGKSATAAGAWPTDRPRGVNARWNSLERCLHTHRQKVPHPDATREHGSIHEPETRPDWRPVMHVTAGARSKLQRPKSAPSGRRGKQRRGSAGAGKTTQAAWAHPKQQNQLERRGSRPMTAGAQQRPVRRPAGQRHLQKLL